MYKDSLHTIAVTASALTTSLPLSSFLYKKNLSQYQMNDPTYSDLYYSLYSQLPFNGHP